MTNDELWMMNDELWITNNGLRMIIGKLWMTNY